MRPPLSYIPLLPVLLLLIAAISVTHFLMPPHYPQLDPESRCYYGQIEEVDESGSGQHLTVSMDALRPYKARLTVPSVATMFMPGDSVTFHCRLSEPQVYDRYCNNHRENFLRRNIYAQAFVIPDSISVTGVNNSIYWKIKRIQPEAARLIKESPLSSGTIEFLCAALIGDDSLVTDSTRSMFSGAGVAHVLALSGLHVGIIAVLITIILFPLYILRMRKALAGITILLLWVYAVLTGLSPSVTRAVVMATALGTGIILQRRNFSFNALLLAAIVILAINPDALFQPGFQLSFASVMCILLTVPLLDKLPLRGVLRYAVTLVIVTVAATVGSGLIAAYDFHTFPLFFIFANIPVLMMLPVLMGAGILIVFLQLFTVPPMWLCEFTDRIYNVMSRYVESIISFPHATIDNIFFSAWVFIPYALFIGMLFAAIYYRKRATLYTAAAFALACIVTALATAEPLNAEDHFIVHSFRDTTIMHRVRNKVNIYTTASPVNAANIKEKVIANYSEYLMKHGVDSIAVHASYSDVVTLPGKRILLLHSDSDTAAVNNGITHVVICRGFSGNPVQVSRRFPHSGIILSRDLHPRRHNRYLDSLQRHNIPAHSLRTDFNADIFNGSLE